jgi:hypothetical protein
MSIGYAESSKAWEVLAVRSEKSKIVESPKIRFNERTASRIRAFVPAVKCPLGPERSFDVGAKGVHDYGAW